MNFFKLYIGDYQRDTAHLSISEHGAYLLMLQHYYATERPLPTGKALYRMLRADGPSDRESIDLVVRQFWTETDAGLVNERARDELGKADAQADTNRRIAIEREARRKGHEPSTNRATSRETVRTTKGQPIQTPEPDTRHQSQSQSQTPEPDARAGEPPQLTPEFEPFLAETYPPTAHRRDFITALHSAMGIVGSGRATEADLRRRLTGFRAFADAGGYTDPSKIPTPQTWFRLHQQGEAYWAREWVLPAPIRPPVPERPRRRTADEIEAEENARAAG